MSKATLTLELCKVNEDTPRATERPEVVGTLKAYGMPKYSVTSEGGGGGWAGLWFRFSAVSPELDKYLLGLGMKFYPKRKGYGTLDNAQGRRMLELMQTSTDVQASTTPAKSGKGKKEQATPTPAPTPAPAPAPAKEQATPAPKRDNGSLSIEAKVKGMSDDELLLKMDAMAHALHVMTQEYALRKAPTK
jgi:hypothetical protein